MKQAHCIVGRGAARRQLGTHICLRLYVVAVFLAFPLIFMSFSTHCLWVGLGLMNAHITALGRVGL